MHTEKCRIAIEKSRIKPDFVFDRFDQSSIQIFVVSPAEPRLPLLIEDAMRADEPSSGEVQAPHANQDTRLDNRVIDL